MTESIGADKMAEVRLSDAPSPVVSVEVKTADGRRFLIKIPGKETHRLTNIFQKQEYALPREVNVEPPLTVVDVGANVGAFALYAAGWSNEVAIHCFEPNPQVIELLRENLADQEGAHVYPVALSNSDGTLALFQHPLNTGQASVTKAAHGSQKVEVPVRVAESALREAGIADIDVLKIDTEGSEVSILRGLGSYLERTSIIMLEYHSEDDRREIDRLLDGFCLYSLEAVRVGVGTAKYINRSLFDKNSYPDKLIREKIPEELDKVIERSSDAACSLISKGFREEAEKVCNALLKAAPQHPHTLHLAALLSRQHGRNRQAQQLLERAVALDATHEQWWRDLSLVLKDVGLDSRSEEANVRADGIQVVCFAQGLGDLGVDQVSDVIRNCEKALTNNPADNAAFFVQTFALLSKPDEAVHSSVPSLDERLDAFGWWYKKRLYDYWLDKVEILASKVDSDIAVVVISNRFKPEIIGNLSELRRQGGDNVQIIFVNNGCADEEFMDLRPWVDVWIKTRGNSGAYLARNIGALYANAPLLLFVDDDGLPEPGLLKAHIDAHAQWNVVAVRGAYTTISGENQPAHYYPGNEVCAAAPELEGNASFCAKAFFDLGGWGDYILFGHGGLDISYRLIKAGFAPVSQIYTPEAILKHEYFRGEVHAKEKSRKQTASFALLLALHSGISKVRREMAKAKECPLVLREYKSSGA